MLGLHRVLGTRLGGDLAEQLDLVVGVGMEVVDRDNDRDAVALRYSDVGDEIR